MDCVKHICYNSNEKGACDACPFICVNASSVKPVLGAFSYSA